MYNPTLRPVSSLVSRVLSEKNHQRPSLCQETDSPHQSKSKSHPVVYVVQCHLSLPDLVCSIGSKLAMKSKLVSSALVVAHRSWPSWLSAAVAATPLIDSNSTSVAAAACWGTPSPHLVADARIPSHASARIPADVQIPAATSRFCYDSPSTQEGVHSLSFVHLLQR
jgi:hypothetical protein